MCQDGSWGRGIEKKILFDTFFVKNGCGANHRSLRRAAHQGTMGYALKLKLQVSASVYA
jgi:hypothetical protein